MLVNKPAMQSTFLGYLINEIPDSMFVREFLTEAGQWDEVLAQARLWRAKKNLSEAQRHFDSVTEKRSK